MPERVAPAGDIYQAGTLSGNPLAMAAGIATLNILKRDNAYGKLEKKSAKLADGVAKAAEKAGVKIYQTRVGAMFSNFFTETEVFDAETARSCDTQRFSVYFAKMLENGVYLAPSQFEAGFMSLAHSDADIEATIEAESKSF